MQKKWSILEKIGFLFLFHYFLFYTSSLLYFLAPFWQLLVAPFAKLLGYNRARAIYNLDNGSGDTIYHFYQIPLFATLAIGFTILTILLERDRLNFKRLLNLLSVILRYYLAGVMITYGLVKLYCLQFPFPSVLSLDQQLGDFSPMALLWTFMGYSQSYSMFTGILEFIAGILLLSGYTSTLGALMTFGVMLNVMMLNYCYDVPVKLLSTHIVFMSIVLIAIDGRNLLNFFILKQPVSSQLIQDIISPKYRTIKRVLKGGLIIAYFGTTLSYMNEESKEYGSNSPKPFFAGKYKVESFQRLAYGNLNVRSIKEDNWNIFYQTLANHAMVKKKNGEIEHYLIEVDTTKQILKMKLAQDSNYQNLRYQSIKEDRYQFYGRLKNDSLNFVMVKEDTNNRSLISREFRWIID